MTLPASQFVTMLKQKGTDWAIRIALLLTCISLFGLGPGEATGQTITTMRPESGTPGTAVRIWGTGFDATASNNTVTFGGQAATVDSAKTSVLYVTVPSGLSGPVDVSVTTGGTTVTAKNRFMALRSNAFDSFGGMRPITDRSSQAVDAADLDADGSFDLVAGTRGNKAVSWFPNEIGSAGAFGNQQVMATYSGAPAGIDAANLGGDERPDVLFTIYPSDRIAWHRNETASSNGFSDTRTLTSSATSTHGTKAADFDNDGDLDVVGVSYNGGVDWFENQGDDTFSGAKTISNLYGAWDLAVADLNGDGDQDIIVAPRENTDVVYYENQLDENGSFASGQNIGNGTARDPISVNTGDLDGDGNPDVIVGSQDDGDVSWYENRLDEDGTFGGERKIEDNGGSGRNSVFVGDFDTDGDVDVLASLSGSGVTAWYENKLSSQGTFGGRQMISNGAIGGEPHAADFTGNGLLDIVTQSGDTGGLAWAKAGEQSIDLALSSSTNSVEVQSDGQTTTDITFTLENTNGSVDATNVTVDVTVPSGLSVSSSSPSSGTYSSGSWDLSTLTAGSSETLTLSVTLNTSISQDLRAQLGLFDQVDPNGASARSRVAPLPYGSGQALAFNGVDNYVDVPGDSTISGDGPYEKRTIEVWFKAEDVDASGRQMVYDEGGGLDGFNIYIRDGTLYAGGWSETNGWNGTWLSTTSVQSGTWHHVALVYDIQSGILHAYLDGKQFGDKSPGSKMATHAGGNRIAVSNSTKYASGGSSYDKEAFFEGRVDQLRLWKGALTQEQLQARAHRTIDLEAAAADSLLLAYRFEAGSGDTVYDLAGFGGTLLDGTRTNSPSWTDPSGASVGRTASVLTDSNSPVTEGPSGSSIEAALASGTGLADDATVYRWGSDSEALVTDPADGTERSNVAWGLWTRGTAEADATISYGNVQGLTTDGTEPVQLLRRPAADARWTSITSNSNVSHSTSSDQFDVTGVTSHYQYAVANAQEVNLALDSSRTAVEIQPNGTATTDVTFTLSNNDSSDDASGVKLSVDVPSGLSVSNSSTGGSSSYSPGTWDVGSLTAGSSVQLTLTLTLSSGTPQDVAATLSELDQVAPNPVETSARIVPVSTGSGQALSFDGSNDYLELSNESRFDLTGNFSISFWMKVGCNSFDDRFEALVTKGTNTWRVHRNGEESTLTFDTNHGQSGNALNGTVSVDDGAWHHVAAVYDQSAGEKRLYVDGTLNATSSISSDVNTNNQPVRIGDIAGKSGRKFGGQIDQVRIWKTPLNQQQVQARAHRTVALDGSVASDLLAAYRFDAGSGTSASDLGGGDGTYTDGAFQGNPKWTDPSGASVGRQSTVVQGGDGTVTVGPSGSNLATDVVTGSGLSDDVTAYRWGREGDAPVSGESLPFGISERSAVAWGLWPRGSAEVNATISYGDVSGLVTDGSEAVRLLRRPEPGSGWTDVTDSSAVSATPSSNQFSISGTPGRYQYAVANAQEVNLTLSTSPTKTDVLPNGSEETTVTFILNHADGTIDATGVEISVSAGSGLTVTGSAPSTGSYDASSGTWSVGTVGSGTSETLDLTVTLSGAVPQDLSGSLSALDQMDSNGASASAKVLSYPYGSGQTLDFDGTDDYVAVPDDESINTNGPYEQRTIELWFKADDVSGSTEQVLYEEGGGVNGLNVYLKSGTLYAGAWNESSNWGGAWLSTTSVQSGTWHHVALVFDQPDGNLRAYLDGRRVGDKSPGSAISDHGGDIGVGAVNESTKFAGSGDFSQNEGRYLAGRIDQVRLWDTALSSEQVQARAHRTMDLDGSKVSDLLLAYRFEAGSGDIVYDHAGFGSEFLDGTRQSSPTWTVVSGARLGRASTTVTDGETATLGPSGGTVNVSSVSTTSGDTDSDTLQVYQYGRTDGPSFTSTDDGEDFSQLSEVDKRLHPVWGFEEIGGVSAEVTIDYSGVQGLSTPENVRLLKRDGPGAPWQDVSDSWTWDASAQTFSKNGLSSFSQYAIGEASTALPVEMVGLEGTATEEGVRLTWKTASEENNARFEVERRASESDWTQVGSVEGAGTTEKPQRYRFTDEELPYAADSVRYRLRQVDLDGTAHYSDPVTIARGAVKELQLLGTAPNPASSQATVRFAVPEETEADAVQMRLYDVLGRQVRTVRAEAEPGRHELRLDVSGLGSGTYFLRLQSKDAIKTQKLTVVR